MLVGVRAFALLIPMLVGGCRLNFDASTARPADADTDADPDDAMAVPDAPGPPVVDFGAGCAVGLAMDEASWTGAAGEIRDACGDNNGAAVEGASRVDDPVRGTVGEVPVPSGCIKIADAPTLHATTGLTMSAWINPAALDGVNPYGVIAKRNDFTNDDAEYTMFVWIDNTVWVDLDGRNDRNHGTRALINGAWQQITVVYDGARPQAQRVAIYVDGVLDAEVPESSASLTPYASTLSIGCLPEEPSTKPQIALGGRIDDVGVWTRAFSAQEVTAWYVATKH